MSNNNSIWFAVDTSGIGYWFYYKPKRFNGMWILYNAPGDKYGHIPKEIIQAITGRTLTWHDDPIEWVPGEIFQIKYPKESEIDRAWRSDSAPPGFLSGVEWAISKIKKLNQ